MATCKDCIHYEPCKDSYYNAEQLSRFPLGFLEKENAEKNCAFFKDRSKFIELPCKVEGDLMQSRCDICVTDKSRCNDCKENPIYKDVPTISSYVKESEN